MASKKWGEVLSNVSMQGSVWIPAMAMYGYDDLGGATYPAVHTGNTPYVPVYYLSATTDLLNFTAGLPQSQWDKTQNVGVEVHWALSVGETDADTLDLDLEYIKLQEGGTLVKAGTTINIQDTVTTAAGLAVDDYYVATGTLSQGDAANGFTTGDATRGFAFEMHLTNLTGVGECNIIGVRLVYEVLF